MRDRFWDAPSPLPRDKWRLSTQNSRVRITLDAGFEPGRLYEVDYPATGARVAGVGMAAIRDAASAFRYRTDMPDSRAHRRTSSAASQSGRFLRQFLHDGFNVDEKDRRAFDLVWPHIAGAGQGSFNERFAAAWLQHVFGDTIPVHGRGADRTRRQARRHPGRVPRRSDSEGDLHEHVGRILGPGTLGCADAHDARCDPRCRGAGERAHLPSRRHAARRGGLPAHAVAPERHWAIRCLRAMSCAHCFARRISGSTSGTRSARTAGIRPCATRRLVALKAIGFPAIPGVSDPRTIEGPGRMDKGHFTALPFLVPQGRRRRQ